MPDLVPITALGADAPVRAGFGPLIIVEETGYALATLSAPRGLDALSPFGLDLPGPGRCGTGDGLAALWTGPGQWMLAAPGRAESDFAVEVVAAAPGCAVTEQTDGWAVFEIASSAGSAPIEALLERTVNLDLSDLGPGAATRTLLEHLSVFILRPAGDRLTILGPRSSAGSLWHALTEKAERFGRLQST